MNNFEKYVQPLRNAFGLGEPVDMNQRGLIEGVLAKKEVDRKLNVYWHSGIEEFYGEKRRSYSALITELSREEVKEHLAEYLGKAHLLESFAGLFGFSTYMSKYGLVIDDVDCDCHPVYYGAYGDKVMKLEDIAKELSSQ